jgi:hypothetical protein
MDAKHCFVTLLVAALPLSAAAQRADGVYHISCMVQMNDAGDGKKTAECTTHPREDARIGLGGEVGFEITSTQQLMDAEGAPEVTDLILFVDGQALPGTHPVVEGTPVKQALDPGAVNSEESEQPKDAVVTYRLSFPITRDLSSDTGQTSWKKILGGMDKNSKVVPVSVGLLNGPPLPSNYRATFVRMGASSVVLFLLLAAALGVAFLRMATRTGVLRDKEPPPAGQNIQPNQRTYSLSRTQIAVWTLVVIYAYMFIWIITGEYNTAIPVSILVILGISAGTFATATAVDKDKQTTQNTTVSTTAGFLSDVSSSDDGASLHRVQFQLWCVVLMIVFCATTYETMAMPDFNTGLLGLMGISSAAYAGMKIPESK